MNYCTNCGEKLESGTKYCPNCGALLAQGSAAVQVTAREQTVMEGFEDSLTKEEQGKQEEKAAVSGYRVVLNALGSCSAVSAENMLSSLMGYDRSQARLHVEHLPSEIACGMPVGKAQELAALMADRGMQVSVMDEHGVRQDTPGRSRVVEEYTVVKEYTETPVNVSPKSRWLAALLCFLFGVLGVHRFYTGKIGSGILWLLTGGMFGIGWFVDLLVILTGGFKDSDGKLLKD